MRHADKLRQLGLGVQLRKLREKAGLSTRSVAKSLGVSPASINRTELGSRSPSRDEVSAMCALFGVVGDEKQELIERVGESHDTAAWLATEHVPDQVSSLMILEREAVRITAVELALIPGLAQTADYARLILGPSARPGVDLERQVATRLGRQAVLSKPKAPQVTMFLDEAVLRRTLGNVTIVREQLRHLLVVQARDNVAIRVLPLDAPPHEGLRGSFALYELADGTPYVFVEARSFGVFVTETSAVQPFVEVCDGLGQHALDAATSAEMISTVAELSLIHISEPTRPY